MLSKIIDIAKIAGLSILDIYYKKTIYSNIKQDGSILTNADTLSNEIIISELKSNFAGVEILSEEGKNIDYDIRKKWSRYFLIDPLDGSKEFLGDSGEFTVNIALIENEKPILGVVYAPFFDLLYTGDLTGQTPIAKKNGEFIRVKSELNKPLSIAISRNHNSTDCNDYIKNLSNKYGNIKKMEIGSSLKFCLVAEGKVSLYPRLSRTMEWDTAAAHAVVKAAGGSVTSFNDNRELRYNKKDLANPNFVATCQKIL